MRAHRIAFVVAASLIVSSAISAQVGRGWSDWLTSYADAQRTSWLRTDPNISLESMSETRFDLQWTSKLGNQSRGLAGLTQGVTASGVTLFVPTSLVAGSSNKLYMLDNDIGHVVWSRTFEGTLPTATAGCSGGITSAPTRIVSGAAAPTPPAGTAATAAGRGNQLGYRSALGEPGQGIPVEARGGGAGRAGGRAPVRAERRAAVHRVAARANLFLAHRTSVAEASAERWSGTRSPVMANCTLSVSSPARTCRDQRRSSRPTRSGRTPSRSAP